jgi:adenylate kinase family enzyme
MTPQRLHIFGASGSGTSTLGRALAARLSLPFFDVDDYYWRKTDPPYREKVPVAQRYSTLEAELHRAGEWVLSGSLVSWGGGLRALFTLAVFL